MKMLRLVSALGALFCWANVALAAGTVPGFSLTPQFDLSGKIMPGCRLYIIQAGTVSTPQNAYQDSGLTLLQPNPMTCDASGRIGQWFVADGNIKLRLTDKNGIQIFNQDGLLVVGASSGGGGGSPVDPTTILQTGQIIPMYGTGIVSGFVRANGRTIGNATSGATERANADTSALFSYLWNADPNLAVSGGRGASAAADFSANKTIALPDLRGRVLAGLDDMGNSAANRLSSSYFGATATTLGATGGAESRTLTASQIPSITSSQSGISVSVSTSGGLGMPAITGGWSGLGAGTGSFQTVQYNGAQSPQTISTLTGSINVSTTSTNTGGAAHATVQPTLLSTWYIKL